MLMSRSYHFPATCVEARTSGRRTPSDQWPAGTEPLLADVLADPLVQLVMRRDGVTPQALHRVIADARADLACTLPSCRARRIARPAPQQQGRR